MPEDHNYAPTRILLGLFFFGHTLYAISIGKIFFGIDGLGIASSGWTYRETDSNFYWLFVILYSAVTVYLFSPELFNKAKK